MKEPKQAKGKPMKKSKQSQAIVKADPAKTPCVPVIKTPFVTVDMSRFAKRKLANVPADKAMAYVSGLPTDELVADNILIGRGVKSFKEWYTDHVEWIHELRGRLPNRGPNSIEVIENGKSTLYLWSEFCLEFYGVSGDWVRKTNLLYEGMKAQPVLPETIKKKKSAPKPDACDQTMVSRLSLETLEHKASTSELRYVTIMTELRSLMQVIKKATDFNELPFELTHYVEGLEERLKALDIEPKAPKDSFQLEELDVTSTPASDTGWCETCKATVNLLAHKQGASKDHEILQAKAKTAGEEL